MIAHIQEIGAAAVIPPRINRLEQRPFDKHQYKHRNLIERFFLRIKHFRRIATSEQRYQISGLLKAGWKQSQIAAEVGVDKSTISREMKRNKGQRGCNGW